MRRLGPRPGLNAATALRLAEKTGEITAVAAADRAARARVIYDASRRTAWFALVVTGLRAVCGDPPLCMYCSSTDPSHIDHFRPLSVFPLSALNYENFVWACAICNQTHKGERFPPDTEPGEQILNPFDDDVWEHFFLDEKFGRLVCRIDGATGQQMPRAVSTANIVGIDREDVQKKRLSRLKQLRRWAEIAMTDFRGGAIDDVGLRARIEEWRCEPFQTDVADYFLAGPGTTKEPFASLIAVAGPPAANGE